MQREIPAGNKAPADRMQKLLKEEEYAAFLSSYGQKRRYSLRVNTLKADREKVLRLLRQTFSEASDPEYDGSLYDSLECIRY